MQIKHILQPSVTKKDIEDAERMVSEVVKMFDAALYNHSMRRHHNESIELRAVRESEESKNKSAVYSEALLSKEPYLTPKPNFGKRSGREHIDMHVKEVAAKPQHGMRDEKTQSSAKNEPRPRPSASSDPTKVYNATPQPSKKSPQTGPKSTQKASPSKQISKADELTKSLSESGAIELSPTGFVHFPRHWDDDDDWERVSRSPTPTPEERPKFDGKVAGKKGMLSSLFGK